MKILLEEKSSINLSDNHTSFAIIETCETVFDIMLEKTLFEDSFSKVINIFID